MFIRTCTVSQKQLANIYNILTIFCLTDSAYSYNCMQHKSDGSLKN